MRIHLTLLLAPLVACSGADGPELGVPLPEPSRVGWSSDGTYPGLNMITPLMSQDVFLVDLEGTVHHRWETEWEPGNSVYLTDHGTIYRCMRIEDDVDFSAGGIGGGIQEIDADGTVLWEYRMADAERHHHHDIEILPNGNILMLAWVKKTREEAIARGRDPELLRGEEFWPDSIFELKPLPEGGEIVWEWHAWDHLVQDFDVSLPNYGTVAAMPHRIDINGDRDPVLLSEEELDAQLDEMAALGYAGGDDSPPPPPPAVAGPEDETEKRRAERRRRFRDADWMHTNAIDYNAALDQIAISVHRFDEIWVIDHSTTTAEAATGSGGRSGKGGDLLYRWGNPAAYGMGHREDRVLIGQHDVQWIEDGQLGAGGLLLFNNGSGREGGDWSSIEEWWPPMDAGGNYLRGEGQRFGPAEVSWRYEAPEREGFFSSFISGVQRLPNGNTLICSGRDGIVFEVGPDGEMLWEWPCDLVDELPEGEHGPVKANSLFRVTRLPFDHPGLEALRAKGVELPRGPAGPGD